MNPTVRGVLAAGALVIASLLAVAGPASAATVQVRIQNADFVFHPSALSISAGDTVEFENGDAMAHDVTFEAGFASGSAGSFSPGSRWNHTFTSNGTFKFRCSVHSSDFSSGMVGTVVVGGASAPPPSKPSPGFELLGALFAFAAVAALCARQRRP